MDSQQLLYDISELSHLFRESASIETLLDRAVEMVARRTQSAVCSIYLYNPQKQELTLRATRGLNPESIGRVHLKLGQGLTGLALQEMRPICEADASRNPNYKFFPGIFEERYNAFLAVPIARGVSKMGVLVLQRDASQCYEESDIAALETVASQLANIIENAQFLLGMHEPAADSVKSVPESLKFVRGKVAAEGFAYGPSMVLDKHKSLSLLPHQEVDRIYTLEEFRRAVACTEDAARKAPGAGGGQALRCRVADLHGPSDDPQGPGFPRQDRPADRKRRQCPCGHCRSRDRLHAELPGQQQRLHAGQGQRHRRPGPAARGQPDQPGRRDECPPGPRHHHAGTFPLRPAQALVGRRRRHCPGGRRRHLAHLDSGAVAWPCRWSSWTPSSC